MASFLFAASDPSGAVAPAAIPIGSARVLLVFAPTADDPQLGQQACALAADAPGAGERDLVPVAVTGDTVDKRRDAGEAARLRHQYGVEADRFAVLLIGKDGGVKLRSRDVVPLARLFALIDSMPMRQAEMRR